MKKTLSIIFILALSIVVVACGATKYNDGEYTGEFLGDANAKTVVHIVIKDQQITECSMECFDKNGDLKDEHYGESSGETNFQKAQRAVEGMKQYPEMLVQTQSIEDMDAVSGATVSFKEFSEAVNMALKQAE